MRRILFTLMAGAALCAFGPAGAMAKGHHNHHRSHHQAKRHAKRHARIRRFGVIGQPGGVTPTTTPTATVTSFDPTTGTLVITLADGTTTETGQVTSDTEIQCESSDQNVGGDVRSDNGGGSGGDQGGSGQQGDDGSGGDGGSSCGTADLTPGASVLGAELSFDSNGAVWNQVDLASTATTTGGGGDD